MHTHPEDVPHHAPPKNVLFVGLTKYLTGESIDQAVEKDWQKANATTKSMFHNVGFDVDPTDFPKAMQDLRNTLQGQPLDGILVGWCLRGYAERTEWFEQTIDVCVDELRMMPKTKLFFCTGPKNLYEATMRNFGQ